MITAMGAQTIPAPGPAPAGAGPLDQPVQFMAGVGPRRTEAFAKLGVATRADLLHYYPRAYIQFQGQVPVAQLRGGENVTVRGRIIETRRIRRRPVRFEAWLEEDSGRCALVWFNRLDLDDKIVPGVSLCATGMVRIYNRLPQMVQPRFELLDSPVATPAADRGPADRWATAHLESVYPATVELPSAAIARIIRENLAEMRGHVPEWFPANFLAERNLLGRSQALQQIHQPTDQTAIAQARRTLAYHEVFLYQLAVGIKRHHQKNLVTARPLRTDEAVDRRIRALFEFQLTAGQNHVVAQLRRDLARPRPMNRLLQGDVGSGKTVVALYAMLMAVAASAQAALLAPTTVLAEQHFLTLQRYLARSRVRLGLLTSGVTAAQRQQTLAALAGGTLDILVGTHALLREDLRFKDLALLVVDEQHKFGVRQRAVIRDRYAGVHTLVMTATPIPRTLAMTLFGDLDISSIEELPPGRTPILTRVVPLAQRDKVYAFIRGQLQAGRQAFVVAPSIEENARELQNVAQLQRQLQHGVLRNFHIGLLHGRMDSAQRHRVMEDFRQRNIDVLVCTTVIEVGVDVPNATLMIVEHADRFGLAQLHQLRGRIGRGRQRSLCVFLSDAAGVKTQMPAAGAGQVAEECDSTRRAAARLAALEKYSSGFKIAEEDLKLRGMGELVGTRQSGHPDFHFPEFLFDGVLLPLTRRDALAVVAADPHLIAPCHQNIRANLLRQYGDAITLADVG